MESWNDERCLKLMDAYEKFRNLWDPRDYEYFHRGKRHEAWIKLGKKFDTSPDDVKRKVESMLGSFRREKSKMKRSRKAGQRDVYESNWFAFKKMSFLLDRDEHRSKSNLDANLLSQNFGDENEQTQLHMGYEALEPKVFVSIEEPELSELSDSSHTEPIPVSNKATSNVNQQFPLKSHSRHKRLREDNANNNDGSDSAAKILRDRATSRMDENDTFGQYVAVKLQSYGRKTQIRVQHEINNILFRADMGKYEYTDVDQFQVQSPTGDAIETVLKVEK